MGAERNHSGPMRLHATLGIGRGARGAPVGDVRPDQAVVLASLADFGNRYGEMPMKTSRVSSVGHLQTLYTVVVGVALTVALEDISATGPGQTSLLSSVDAVLLLVAFIATLLPFYHGALRHLDVTWIEKEGRDVKSGALLADFVILFVEGCLFLLIARQLSSPFHFGAGLAALFAIDVIWGIVAHVAFTQPGADKAEWKWVQNNVVAVIALLALLFSARTWVAQPAQATWMVVGLLIVALVRTVVDYVRSWDFYYPADAPPERAERALALPMVEQRPPGTLTTDS
jgi:hypothetical protein